MLTKLCVIVALKMAIQFVLLSLNSSLWININQMKGQGQLNDFVFFYKEWE
ncbi:hypothetical protein BTTAP_10180 [Brochothrix thermosphacta]|nr:hypothetical protein BTTAP_10180 [Brochothrix thermosphacta]